MSKLQNFITGEKPNVVEWLLDYRPNNEKPYYLMSVGRKNNLIAEGEFVTEREALDKIGICVKCKVADRWEQYTCCMECIIG